MSTAQQPSPDEYIKALKEISQAISSDLFLDDLFRLIVMVVAKVTGVDICSLWLLDSAAKPPKIRLRATQAIDPEYVVDRTLNLGEGVVGHVLNSGEPLVIPDVPSCTIYKEKRLAEKLGLVSMVSVPLQVSKGKIIGVLNCFTTEPHQYSETDINMLTTVANQAALAIANTDLLVKTQIVQEELRARKTIERAKEVIMERQGLNGAEAYRWIQKRSMDSRKSMAEVADAVLLSSDMF